MKKRKGIGIINTLTQVSLLPELGKKSRHGIRKTVAKTTVILAWMPESSAMDGKRMITNKIIKCTASHPCDWIPASMLE